MLQFGAAGAEGLIPFVVLLTTMQSDSRQRVPQSLAAAIAALFEFRKTY